MDKQISVMKIVLPQVYSQWDSRWANELLGFNTDPKYNIYNFGCLITCLAMVSQYFGKEETPSSINKKLKDKKGFTGGGLYVWGAFPKIYPEIPEEHINTSARPVTDLEMSQIRQAIDNGIPVMIQLDVNPKTVALDTHFVLIIGYNPSDENDFTIADPLGGKIRSLKDYLGWFKPSARRTIEQIAFYKGKPLQKGQWLDEETFKRMVNEGSKWREVVTDILEIHDRKPEEVSIDELKYKINGIKSEATTYKRRLENIREEEIEAPNGEKQKVGYFVGEYVNRVEQVSRLKGELLDKDKLIESLTVRANSALKKVEEIEGVYKGYLEKKEEEITQLARDKGDLNSKIVDLQGELQKCKNQPTPTPKKIALVELIYAIIDLIKRKKNL